MEGTCVSLTEGKISRGTGRRNAAGLNLLIIEDSCSSMFRAMYHRFKATPTSH